MLEVSDLGSKIQIAQSLFKQNKYKEVINACKEILNTGDNSIEAIKLIAKSFLAIKNIDDARLYFDQALTLKPDDYEVIKDLGNLYQAIGDINNAKSYYQKALAINGNYAPALTNLGTIEITTGNKQNALSLLIKATESAPQSAPIWGNLANGYFQLGKIKEAESSARKAIEINPNLFNSHFLLGTILFAQKRLQEAEQSLRKTIELNSDFLQAHLNLGAVLQELKHLQEAESSTRKAIELNPNIFNSHYLLGIILFEQRKLQEAEQSLRKTIELKPDFSKAHFNLGAVLKKSGQLQEAELSTRKAIEIEPNYTEAHYNLGIIVKDLGNLKEAEISIRKAISIQPSSNSYFAHASCLYEMKEFDSSLESLNKSKELVNSNSTDSLLIKVSTLQADSAKTLSINSSKAKKESKLFDKRVDRLIINREVEDELIYHLNTIKTRKLDSTKDSRYGKGMCSNFKLFEDTSPIISKLSHDIEEICKRELEVKEIFFIDSFFNIFVSGSGQPSHFHLKEVDQNFNLASKKYSLVYYLDIGDQDCDVPGIITLHDPHEEILPKKGMMILIGAERYHSVSYQGNKKRVMVGVNFYGV